MPATSKVARLFFKKRIRKIFLLGTATLFSIFLFTNLIASQRDAVSLNNSLETTPSATSSEINIAESSPLGSAGGLVVPASCPSDLHDAPTYGQPCSASNACGTNNGTIQCGGSCNAIAPSIPGNYGNNCSACNGACGCNPGTIQCNGACSATPPAKYETNRQTLPCSTWNDPYADPDPICIGGSSTDIVTYCDGSWDYQNNTCYETTCSAGPSPTCDTSCAASTCSGQTCKDSCGNTIAGTYAGYEDRQSRTCASWGLGSGTGYVDVNSCTGMGSNYDTSGCTSSCDTSCAANTCSSDTCTDSCGNAISGTKTCATCNPWTGRLCSLSLLCPDSSIIDHYGSTLCDGSCDATTPDISECATPPFCGDGICNGSEDCSICSGDCGSCPVCSPFIGRACPEVTNSCGLSIGTNTILCDGSCDTAAAPESWCVSTHTISATSGLGGSISPSGFIPVSEGDSLMFSITPSTGYVIDTVVVDGFNIGPAGTYAFNNIVSDHTIRATFTAISGPFVNFSANPISLPSGDSSLLTWNTGGGVSSCWAWNTLNQAPWTGSKSAAGSSEAVTITATNDYFIECWDGAGTTTGIKNITINTIAAGGPSVSFSASPVSIPLGNSSTLKWVVTGATSCVGWTSIGNPGDFSGNKNNLGDSQNVTPLVDSKYNLECFDGVGRSSGVYVADVTLTSALAAVHICPSSATIAPASTFQLKAYYTAAGTGFTNCVAPNGSNVTANAGTNWTSLQPAKVSVNNAGSKGLVTGVSGSTTINGTYSGITGTATVTVTCSPTNSCASTSSQTKANAICTSDSFTINDGCGVSITCSGNRTCDYNWKEVAP